MKRSRGRNRRSGGNPQNAFNNPNRHYESVGPDVKIRGSAQQVLEKYLQYARDAQTSGDRILSEAYFQFAEHYQRIVAKQQEVRLQQQNQHQNRGDRRDDRDDRDGRSGGDRDYRRNMPSEGADMGEEEAGEAVVTSTAIRHDDDGEGADSLRVIDTDDEGDDGAGEDEAELATEEAAPEEPRERAPRGRRKPYRAREERAPRQKEEAAPAAGSETEGVMKTLSRGRRRASSEETTSAETD